MIVGKNSTYIFKLRLIKKIGFFLYLLNWIFQRLFRINSKTKFNLHYTSIVVAPQDIKFQKDFNTLTSFSVSGGCYFQAINGIRFGKNVLIAPGVKIISANHSLEYPFPSVKTDPVIIGDNCWIAANVVILPGVKIGNNCVIGAGSIVTKSFEDNAVIAGNPARIIKYVKQ